MYGRAVFLDRDGVIIENVPYLSKIDQIRILDGAAKAIQLLHDLSFKVIIVTNQSAIARGILTEEKLGSIHKELVSRLQDLNAKIDAIYYCPHHPEAKVEKYKQKCSCRKPGPGMIVRAANEHSIDLKHSYMIGDCMEDVEAGLKVGCIPILISIDTTRNKNNLVTKVSLLDAANHIKRCEEIGNRQN